MRTHGMKMLSLLLAVLLCALTLPARAENVMSFSDWLNANDDSGAPVAGMATQGPASEAPPDAFMQAIAEQAASDSPAPDPTPTPEPAAEAPAVEEAPAEAEVPAEEAPAEEAAQSSPSFGWYGEDEAQATPEPVATQAPTQAKPIPNLAWQGEGFLGAGAELEPAPTLEPIQTLCSARIRAVGDLMVHTRQLSLARQSDGSYDFHSQYALIADSLADADYTFANLETTIGKYRNMDYSGFPMFNTPESLLDAVRDAGVDFLTLANNHMLDRYFEGLVNTVNNVEQYGFDFGGANRSPEERDAARVIEVNGIGIGVLCYTQMTNGMESYCNANAVEYGVNYLRKANFAADVQKLRDAGADVVIALPHWGEEYKRKPEGNTVALAKLLIASGVDVILGSHPHMVQPVRFEEAEAADGALRRGLVAYSLGNFISNMTKRYTDSGIILEFTIQERQDGGFDIENVGCVPVYCWRSSGDIQALSSLKYMNERPEGMDSDTWNYMKITCEDLKYVLGDDMKLLAE